jgi:acyl-CoA synthetase (AMP-forming)/AMP-acid ligase II
MYTSLTLSINIFLALFPFALTHHIARSLAIQAGLLGRAVMLLMRNDKQLALAKLGCWLLSNVTSPLSSHARDELLQQPATLARLVYLAERGQPGEEANWARQNTHKPPYILRFATYVIFFLRDKIDAGLMSCLHFYLQILS